MVEFRSAIVDECGYVVYWCNELSENKIYEILEEHQEWRLACVEW